MGDTKIRIPTTFLENDLYDEAYRLKERHEKIIGAHLSDSGWFALLIKDGLPIRRGMIERLEGRGK